MMAAYHPIRTDEKTEWRDSLDEEAFDLPVRSKPSLGSKIAANSIWGVHLILLLASSWMFICAKNMQSSTLQHVKEYSAWSPAAEAVQYHNVKYNLTTKNNRFVGASPDVDKAWREITYDMGDQMIADSDLAKIDMPETSLRVTHPVTGKEGYRVGMEAFHHLHCINLLRKVTYKDYYNSLDGEFDHGQDALQAHTDHCLEVLRVNAMCTADIGVFTFYMLEGDPLPWPQLNSNHKCRNFDRVLEWAHEHSVGNMEIL